MSTGLGLGVVLAVIGAILIWAVQAELPFMDRITLGWILIGAGVLSAIVGIILGMVRGRATTVSQTTLDNGQTATTTTRSNVSDV